MHTTLHTHLETLMSLHRRRRYIHKSEKSLTLQLKSCARYYATKENGWQESKENKSGKAMAKPDDKHMTQAEIDLPDIVDSISRFKAKRKELERMMVKVVHALDLPTVHALFKAHRGVGDLTFAQLLAEAGVTCTEEKLAQGLDRFDTVSKVWKRFGVAVIDGERQRRIAGDPELAIRHGYNAERRSVLWQIGVNFVMKGDEFYKKMYTNRKAFEASKGCTPGHADARARRYISKDFLKRFFLAYLDDIEIDLPLKLHFSLDTH